MSDVLPDLEQVSKFYYPSRDAAYYVKEPLSSDIEVYYGLCLKVADLTRLGNNLYYYESSEIKTAFNAARKISEPIDRDFKVCSKKVCDKWLTSHSSRPAKASGC